MLNLNSKIAGWYKIEAGKKDGSRKVLADWFPNLITNGGLDRIGITSSTWADYLNYCHVGAGNTVPAYTDTALASPVAITGTIDSTSRSNQSTTPFYCTITRVFYFGAGVAAGNLAEVGVGWSNSNTDLYSRALILDSGGSPTTITVLSDEYLYITYQLRRYIPEIDTSSVVTIVGVNYTFTGRVAYAHLSDRWRADFCMGGSMMRTAYNGSLGSMTSIPSGTGSGDYGGMSISPYVAGNHYIDREITFGINLGNVGGISAFLFFASYSSAFQFGVSPAIPKTADDILTITYRESWSRH